MKNDELNKVEECVYLYLNGVQSRNIASLSTAFYSVCNLYSTDSDDKLEIVALHRFFAFIESTGLPEHASKILNSELCHDMASVKVMFDFEHYQFVDYLTLLKINDQWKIVSKVYTKIIK